MHTNGQSGSEGAGGAPDGLRSDLLKVAKRLSLRLGHVAVAALVAVVASFVAVASQPTAQETSTQTSTETAAPVITSVLVDVAQQMLTINGVNFGTTAPTVSLALTPMTVTTPTTATQVQATLSTLSTLSAGTYRVVLQRSDAVTADFPVTIGAVGPPGPAGVSVPVYQ